MNKPDLRSMKQNPQQLMDIAKTIDPNTLRQVQNTVRQYHGKSQDQLMSELGTIAQRERAAGKLDNAKIDNIASALGPMLDPVQYQQMQAMMQQLKNN